MKILATRKSEQNRAVIDPWTAVHFASGLAAGLVRIPFGWSFGVAVGYEIAEQVLERHSMGRELFDTQGPETTPNAVMDVAVFTAGYRLGERWNRTGGTRD